MKKIIKYLLLLIILLIPFSFTYAETVDGTKFTNKVETKERTSDNKYGVNKHWNINDSNKKNVMRTPYVNSKEKIYDFSNVLTIEEKEKLYNEIKEFENKYKTELIILTYSLPYKNDVENEDFAADFYDYNDFGLEYEKYNGILLFRNTYAANPYYDMYTFGMAQTYFNQSRYDYILDSIYPDIKGKNYYAGFSGFISYVNNYYEVGPANTSQTVTKDGYLTDKYNPPIFGALIAAGFVTFIVISIMVGKNKMVRKATQATEYLDKPTINIKESKNIFLRKHTSSYTSSSSSGGGGHSGGGSHSGSSGGGHSSGGGRHG